MPGTHQRPKAPRPVVRLNCRHWPQSTINRLAGDIEIDVAMSLAPPENRTDPLAELARRLGLRCPNRSEIPQDVLTSYLVDREVSERGTRSYFSMACIQTAATF